MQEFMIPLDSKSEVPLYEQVCEYVKTEIQQGHLKAGEKLPSSRKQYHVKGTMFVISRDCIRFVKSLQWITKF